MLALIPILIIIAIALTSFAAWVTNAIYLFNHFNALVAPETILSIVGVVLAPLGSLHGLYIWLH